MDNAYKCSASEIIKDKVYSLALPPLRMERKGLVKPVYTTCPIGMHLWFYTSRVTYGEKRLLRWM